MSGYIDHPAACKESYRKTRPEDVRAIAGSLMLLILSAAVALHLPTRIRLELYDVEDLVYTLRDMPGVEISLAAAPPVAEKPRICGEDLVNGIRALMPGVWEDQCGRMIQYQNELVIVRGTAAQQFVVRSCLSIRRVWVRLRS